MSISVEFKKLANPKRAKTNAWFFKTGKGEYGEGDQFLGISMPDCRKVVKKYYLTTTLQEVETLFLSKYHEERMAALLIVVSKYEKSPAEEYYLFYLKLLSQNKLNNWDFIDASASQILGNFLIDKKDREILYTLSKSNSLWERRASVIACFQFIKNNDFSDILKLSKNLLSDKEDLMHKAIGWMLREVGKRDGDLLKTFLNENYDSLPRTTLRYAIEKFEEKERKKWLRLKK